jgi:hypothetical protein
MGPTTYRAAHAVERVHISPVGQQQLHTLHVALGRRQVQGRALVVVGHIGGHAQLTRCQHVHT